MGDGGHTIGFQIHTRPRFLTDKASRIVCSTCEDNKSRKAIAFKILINLGPRKIFSFPASFSCCSKLLSLINEEEEEDYYEED